MLKPVYQIQFKKDVKLAQKRGKNIEKLKYIMNILLKEFQLPEKKQKS